MPHYDTARDCPKCGVACLLVMRSNGERENTCPSCKFSFVDMTEQFDGNYYGVIFDPGDDTIEPPTALFSTKEECESYVKYLQLAGRLRSTNDAFRTRCSIYGICWTNEFEGEDPWADEFQPFIPDALPVTVKRTLEIVIPPVEDVPQFTMSAHGDFDGDPVYFCKETQRYYLFALFPAKVGPPCPRAISVPVLPRGAWRAFLYAIWTAIRETELRCNDGISEMCFLTWTNFQKFGGKIQSDLSVTKT